MSTVRRLVVASILLLVGTAQVLTVNRTRSWHAWIRGACR